MNASRIRFLIILLVLTSLVLAGCSTIREAATELLPKSPAVAPDATPPDPRVEAINAALQAATHTREDVLAFIIYDVVIDHLQFSEDGDMALVWLAMVERESGEIIPGEPGLVIARREDEGWRLWFQSDPDWSEQLEQVPDSMLSAQLRANYRPEVQKAAKAGVVYTGYKLPWPAGLSKRVSGSIGHVFTYKTCPSTCLYAFDFADGTMFPVVAAKAGRVKYAVWQWPNGNTKNTNFLVLEDDTTTPTTYQVYYHLAQDSIPANLRVSGTQVYQGQFLANADDTGASTGHHLHFHVHTNKSSYWGTSVDITFEDVTVNGGRPRTCAEAAQFPEYGSQCMPKNLYTSTNGDNQPPTGNLTSPAPDSTITTPTMEVIGWASDDTGVATMQLLANWNGEWKSVGEPLKGTPFSTTVNLCEIGIPNGPFLLAMDITDKAGRHSSELVGRRVLNKEYECSPAVLPTPAAMTCEPEADQVALFSQANYQGACHVFSYGEYASPSEFGDLRDDRAASIRVGVGVVASVYDQAGFKGVHEYLNENDPDLSDNVIGAGTISSLYVLSRPELPEAAVLNSPHNAQDMAPTDLDPLVLTWSAGGEGTEYRSELSGPAGLQKSLDWQTQPVWEVGQLPPGDYTWLVWARNPAGEVQSSLNFIVRQSAQTPETRMKPMPPVSESTALLLEWEVSEGAERVDHFEVQYRDSGLDWTPWERSLPGQSRQAWFLAKPGGLYEFRIRSFDLGGNAEYLPVDAEVVVQVPAECPDDPYESATPQGDDQFIGAAPLALEEAQEHNLCGMGDEDWVQFQAETGKSYRISTNPLGGGAAVHLQLYNTDGYSLLGEQIPADFGTAASLDWIAPADGTYYLRLLPIDPGLSGPGARYQVKVESLGQVFIPGLVVCGGGALPVLWLLYKALMGQLTAQKMRKDRRRQRMQINP